MCVGVDLNPAIEAQGIDAVAMANQIQQSCIEHAGAWLPGGALAAQLLRVAKILNIDWVAQSLSVPVQLICARSQQCLRQPSCYQATE